MDCSHTKDIHDCTEKHCNNCSLCRSLYVSWKLDKLANDEITKILELIKYKHHSSVIMKREDDLEFFIMMHKESMINEKLACAFINSNKKILIKKQYKIPEFNSLKKTQFVFRDITYREVLGLMQIIKFEMNQLKKKYGNHIFDEIY